MACTTPSARRCRPGDPRIGGPAAPQSAAARPLPQEDRLVTQSHLMIANPFGGAQGLASLFASHPPMEQRIARLEQMARGPGLP